MKITYSLNPYLPLLRAKAVALVRSGKSIREVARYLGFNASTVSRWVKKVPNGHYKKIPTKSSRPHYHPKQLPLKIVQAVINKRAELKGRCAEAVHKELQNDGIQISLSSVKRTLDRNQLLRKRSPWKHVHDQTDRPKPEKPGDLIEIDTIHLGASGQQIYIYTMLDVYSRYAHAWATDRINTRLSISFLKQAQRVVPFSFVCVQSDHGSEFSQHFTERIHITHRHSRVRTPNDNAHLERFNRTIQEELINYLPNDPVVINKALKDYLPHYNTKRVHLGIGLKTPIEML